jgi:tetratricopeptide (TPR) repeat protein
MFEKSRIYGIPFVEGLHDRRIFTRRILQEIVWGSFIPNCTALIRREVFDKVGFYDEYFRNCEDRDLWIRIDRHYSIGYINHPLARVRIHGNNMTNLRNSITLLNYGKELVQRKVVKSGYKLSSAEKRNVREYLSMVNFELGFAYSRSSDHEKADLLYREALRINPFNIRAIKQIVKRTFVGSMKLL